MISLTNNNKFITESRLSSMTFTVPKTYIFFYGNFYRKDIIHNLIISLKSATKEMSNKTYVRGEMTGWYSFKGNRDFSVFFSHVMNQAKIALFPKADLTKELKLEEAWGNILKKGDSVEPHVHHTHHGILYLTKGNPLIFPEIEMTFTPDVGDFILTPPQVLHGVDPITDDLERMCVVFNYTVNDGFKSVNEKFNNQ
jgi:hypothetical protein